MLLKHKRYATCIYIIPFPHPALLKSNIPFSNNYLRSLPTQRTQNKHKTLKIRKYDGRKLLQYISYITSHQHPRLIRIPRRHVEGGGSVAPVYPESIGPRATFPSAQIHGQYPEHSTNGTLGPGKLCVNVRNAFRGDICIHR